MDQIWIPVNPILDVETGEFITLKNYGNGAMIKPNPLEGADPGRSQIGEEKKFSYAASSNLEMASIGGVQASFGSTTFIHDSLIYRISRAPIEEGSNLVRGTWWGFGMRLKVMVKNIQFGLNVSWATLAASVQLGYAEAEFEIESIGIADAEIFSLLPNPTDLNIDSLNSILEAGNLLRQKYITADPENVVYQPIRIQVSKDELIKVDPILDDRHWIFTQQQIARRRPINRARQFAIEQSLDPVLIEQYYQQLEIEQRPTIKQRNEARAWLSI